MNPITEAHLEGVEDYEQANPHFLIFDKQSGSRFLNDEAVLSFLTTYGINLLKAAKKAGPGEEDEGIDASVYSPYGIGFNDCRSSFRSAIDEGIKEIRNN